VRADRLVAIVLVLQVHGQRTASQLADALGASERTIRLTFRTSQ
jgi:predicted DNA-binding transcriptional regulator YafY